MQYLQYTGATLEKSFCINEFRIHVVPGDTSVGQFDDTVGFRCDMVIMGYDHQCSAQFTIDRSEQSIYLIGCFTVEVTRRFIAQYDGRIIDQRLAMATLCC